jgi:predicted DNA-binding transcriptional regulator YafY
MKLDRLLGILTVLLQTDKTTAPELAARFGVSRRTILRDVEALCLAGIPVSTARGEGGGISIMEGYKIGANVLTEDELAALAAGLAGVDSVSKTPNLSAILDKLSGAPRAPESVMNIDLASFHGRSLSDKIALLRRAIRELHTVEFDYAAPGGFTRREIEPYKIDFRWGAWYIFGYCRLRGDFRLFKLNRLWNYSLTDNTFEPRPIPADRDDADAAFPEQYRMEIRFHPSARYRLIEEFGQDCYTEDDDGLHFSLDYTNREYIFGWLLAFGDKAEVLSPPEAREEFAAIARNLFNLYNPT